jgi:hypothetical protein
LYIHENHESSIYCADELQELRGKLGENISTTRRLLGQLEENTSTTSASSASTATCNAQGLAVVRLRKLSATLGGSTSTRPGVRKLTLKTCDFININNATIPTALGGSTTTSPPIVVVILRQQLDYVIVDHAAPEKS